MKWKISQELRKFHDVLDPWSIFLFARFFNSFINFHEELKVKRKLKRETLILRLFFCDKKSRVYISLIYCNPLEHAHIKRANFSGTLCSRLFSTYINNLKSQRVFCSTIFCSTLTLIIRWIAVCLRLKKSLEYLKKLGKN